MPSRVILDTDPGIDDALTILLAISSPEVELIGVGVAGGNCSLTEKDRVVVKHGVTLVGYSNLPAMLAADASALYARNVLAFVNLLLDPKSGAPNVNREDEIIAGALVCTDGRVVMPET